jgi:hypothetical protein
MVFSLKGSEVYRLFSHNRSVNHNYRDDRKGRKGLSEVQILTTKNTRHEEKRREV